jgi:poly(A) polymerase
MKKEKIYLPEPETISLLNKLDGYLSGKNIEAYIVGGFVRDLLLNRPTADIDIAVAADARKIAFAAAESLGGKYVLLDDANAVARVVLTAPDDASSGGVKVVDFSSYTGDIRHDLSRRDFTINAMAVSLRDYSVNSSAAEIVDILNGKGDIGLRVIRAVDDKVFSLDAVRLLRAVRLAAELGFTIEEKTENLIREYARLIPEVPGERIREELMRFLAIPGAGRTLVYLDKLGLLTGIFPELEKGRGVAQPKEHYWDVLYHSLAAVKALEFILGEGSWEYVTEDVLADVPLSPVILEHLDQEVSSGSTRKSLLKLSALLHDIGKPGKKTLDDNGRMRFLGHDKEGAELVAGMLENLRFSGKEIKIIETAINYHMRPTQMSGEGMPADRAIYRYFRDTGETGIDILFLNLADHLAARGPELDMKGWKEHSSLVEYVINKHHQKENIVNPPKIVDGYDIIKLFRVNPGPQVGRILEAVREAQASGEINDREEALSFIRNLIQTDSFPEERSDIN